MKDRNNVSEIAGGFYKTEITTKDGNTDEIYMLWRNMKDGLHFENEVKTFLNITKEAAEDQTVK